MNNKQQITDYQLSPGEQSSGDIFIFYFSIFVLLYGIMKSVLLFVKNHCKAFLFVFLSVLVLCVYFWPASGYMEQQRTLWNEYMDQSPGYDLDPNVIILYERSKLYDKRDRGGECLSTVGSKEVRPMDIIQATKDKIYDLNKKKAPDWQIEVPLKPDLEKLSFEGMTEIELLSLPANRHSPEYYAELLVRFQKDGQKSHEILNDMQKEDIPHSSFLRNLFQYRSGFKRACFNVSDSYNIPQIPGYEDYMASVNSGNFTAYRMGKIIGFVPDSSLMEKYIRDKADQGDPLAQKQLGDLLMAKLQNNYNMADTWRNWDKAYNLPSFLVKCLDFLPANKATMLKEKLLNKIPKESFLNKLPEKKNLDEILHWYRKAADQGNTDAMYAWLTGHFNCMPRYFTRSDWRRVRDYNDTLMSMRDWRVCLQLTLTRKITLAFIPFLLYSRESLNSLVKKVDGSGRGDGSLSSLKYSFLRQPRTITGIAGGNRPGGAKITPWEPLSTPEIMNLAERLQKLAKISPYSCTFNFINRNYIEKSSAESIQITKNVLEESSQKGDPVSLYILGWFYQEGIGYAKDAGRAMELWEKAFLSFDKCGGSDVSLAPDIGTVPLVYALPRKLIEYNLNPDFPQRNPARAFEIAIMMQDCDLSKMERNTNFLNRYEPSFLYFLGNMYEQGAGTIGNPYKAFSCYQKGRGLGNTYCTFGMGRCYELGIGEEIDKSKACSLYNEAFVNTNNPELNQIIEKQLEELEKSI